MTQINARLDTLQRRVEELDDTPRIGSVSRIVGLTIEANGPWAEIGELVEIAPPGQSASLPKSSAYAAARSLRCPLARCPASAPAPPFTQSARS